MNPGPYSSIQSLKLRGFNNLKEYTANYFSLLCPSNFFPVSATALIHLTGTADCSFHLHTPHIKICQASPAV